MAVLGWKGRCLCWVPRHAPHHCESHPAVANSIPVPPIARAPNLPWREEGEQKPSSLFGFHSGNDSGEGVQWHLEVQAVLLSVGTDMALLSSHVPPVMHLQGLCSDTPRTGLGKGMPGAGHVGHCCPRGSQHCCWRQPSLSTDLHAHQHQHGCL